MLFPSLLHSSGLWGCETAAPAPRTTYAAESGRDESDERWFANAIGSYGAVVWMETIVSLSPPARQSPRLSRLHH